MIVSLIAAMARNHVIGKDNQLPWKLPEDLKRFKAITLGHPIIMGRKTFDSLGRPLPGRENIVLSRRPGLVLPGATVFGSLAEAFERFAGTDNEVFVIGGAEIYAQALSRADRLYLTRIDADFPGDAFFPEVDWRAFTEVSCEVFETPLPHRYLVYNSCKKTG